MTEKAVRTISYTTPWGMKHFRQLKATSREKMYTVTQEYMGKFQVKVLQTLEQTAKETGMEEYREDKLEEICCQ